MGWMVEVYGWRASMSSCYPAMAALSRGRMVIQYLDEWRAEVTSATERVCVCVWVFHDPFAALLDGECNAGHKSVGAEVCFR